MTHLSSSLGKLNTQDCWKGQLPLDRTYKINNTLNYSLNFRHNALCLVKLNYRAELNKYSVIITWIEKSISKGSPELLRCFLKFSLPMNFYVQILQSFHPDSKGKARNCYLLCGRARGLKKRPIKGPQNSSFLPGEGPENFTCSAGGAGYFYRGPCGGAKEFNQD